MSETPTEPKLDQARFDEIWSRRATGLWTSQDMDDLLILYPIFHSGSPTPAKAGGATLEQRKEWHPVSPTKAEAERRLKTLIFRLRARGDEYNADIAEMEILPFVIGTPTKAGETPRTDAIWRAFESKDWKESFAAMHDHAELLEAELIAMAARVEELEKERDAANLHLESSQRHLARETKAACDYAIELPSLRTSLAQAKADGERMWKALEAEAKEHEEQAELWRSMEDPENGDYHAKLGNKSRAALAAMSGQGEKP
jgi:hypothetical protein